MKRRMIVAALALAACAAPADSALPSAPTSDVTSSTQAIDMTMEAAAAATQLTTTTTTEPVAATVTETAVRDTMAQVTETIPPPPMTAEQICNSQVYGRQLEPPAEACFRAVTTERGWTQTMTDAWVPFAITLDHGILYGESEHCPNRVGGDWVRDDCTVYRCSNGNSYPTGVNQLGQAYCQRGGTDTGFGQATKAWWGPNAIGCRDHGYCSRDSIVASPYHSMLASVIILIEEDGSRPWCWSGWAVRYHHCWNAPDR